MRAAELLLAFGLLISAFGVLAIVRPEQKPAGVLFAGAVMSILGLTLLLVSLARLAWG